LGVGLFQHGVSFRERSALFCHARSALSCPRTAPRVGYDNRGTLPHHWRGR
jgi:hypothetical protein